MLTEEQIMNLIESTTESTMKYVLELGRLKKEGRLRGPCVSSQEMGILMGIATVEALYWTLETPFLDMKNSHTLWNAWADASRKKVKV